MRTPTHHAAGLAAGLAVAHWLPETAGPHLPARLAFAALAAATAGGAFSPDVDNQRWWQRLDRVLPDEWLGHSGPLGHRRLMHWWGLPVIAWLAAYALAAPAPVVWAVHAVCVGWASHLAGDLVFGKANERDHRGPGIPVMPWWGHIGFGLDADGLIERLAGVALAALCLQLSALLAGVY